MYCKYLGEALLLFSLRTATPPGPVHYNAEHPFGRAGLQTQCTSFLSEPQKGW